MDSFEKWWYAFVDTQEFSFGSNGELAKQVARRAWGAGGGHLRDRIFAALRSGPEPQMHSEGPAGMVSSSVVHPQGCNSRGQTLAEYEAMGAALANSGSGRNLA